MANELEGRKTFQQSYSGAQSSVSIVTPASGSNIALWGYVISTDTATTFTLELTDSRRGGSTANAARFYFAANGGANLPVGIAPFARGNANAALAFSSTGSGNVAVTVVYTEIP